MCLQKILERVALTRACSLKYPLMGCLVVILGVATRQLYGLFSGDGGQRLEDFSANIWWDTRGARYDAFSDLKNRMVP